jgi:Flp pilus assembly pilin Flp
MTGSGRGPAPEHPAIASRPPRAARASATDGTKGSPPMILAWKNFMKADGGSTAIEYALIAGILGVALIASLTSIKTGFGNVVAAAGNGLSGQ